jgi:hypothetical protein
MAVGYLVIRFHKAVIKALPVAAVVVMMAVLVSLGQSAFGIARSSGDVVASQAVAKADNAYPDIYVIIPDRFGSPEALKESGLDASWFVQELRDRGFYVRENAMSSDAYKAGEKAPQTTRTLRFLASLLNFGESVDLGMGYNEAGGMVRNPEAVRVLHSMGYICYNVGSWYPETAISRAADHNYVYRAANPVQWLYVQEFGAAVLDRSIWRYFIITGDQTERDRQMFQLGAVKEIASGDVAHPKFVFVHLLLPHPPFVWAADGQPQNGDSGEMTKYLEQVQFTEGYLLEMLDSIPDDAIVILESDEGICFTRPAFLNEGLSDTQWNGVLVAWRIAGADLAAVGHTEILGYAIDYLEGQ